MGKKIQVSKLLKFASCFKHEPEFMNLEAKLNAKKISKTQAQD